MYKVNRLKEKQEKNFLKDCRFSDKIIKNVLKQLKKFTKLQTIMDNL